MEFKQQGIYYPTCNGCTEFTHFFLISSLRLKKKIEELGIRFNSSEMRTFAQAEKVKKQIRVLKSQYVEQNK